jgi:hypothetical protein
MDGALVHANIIQLSWVPTSGIIVTTFVQLSSVILLLLAAQTKL